MSSSSTSKSNPRWIYNVFINFRGIDTRKNFVSHLNAALKNAGVNTFLDDEKLGKGEELGPELLRAIQGSQICVVVFSKSYTSSKWCLHELVEIMDCRTTHGQVVLPIFYDVDPASVRRQKGAFGEALKALASKIYSGIGVKKYTLSKWRTALTEAGKLAGWNAKTSRNEAELVMEIVENILTRLDDTLFPITDFPVGLESRVKEVIGFIKKQTGTKAIEGLALNMESSSKDCFDTKAFEKMKRLRLLKLNNVKLVGDYKYLPKSLRWVHWQGFPEKHIPDNFDQQNVVAIDLKYSKINLVWKRPQFLERLKFLNLSHSSHLTHTPNFSKLPNLEKLVLKDCPRLSKLHKSIGDLRKILEINLMNCASLNNLPRRIYKLKSLETLILSGCLKIDMLKEEIVQMESLTTLIANHIAVKDLARSILRSRSIAQISLYGCAGLAHDVFPFIISSWMSPTMNPLSHIHPPISSSLVSIDVQNINWGDLAPMFCQLSILQSVWVGCCSKAQLTQELRRVLDGLYGVNFTELERTSYASQVSYLYLRFIGMGCCNEVIETLGKSISQGLTIGVSADFLLPGNNYPCWLTHTGEGHSVYFTVPQVRCRMKGMALCVVYSSILENVTAQCLVRVLIVNYTKCIFQIYKRDTTVSFKDEDWQNIISNLGPGDKVGIFVAFGHGFTIKKTSVYLICDESMDGRSEPSQKLKRRRLQGL
ncbi:hypothetical protein RJT34_21942 [Clitoria ternatea]|uniref:TIR domain-containing protein n=1 Tax=Clitoria ternatea TaxID=43366 RepID=A0AAN9P6Q2_CLITE